MSSTELRIVAMKSEYASEITRWRYDGIYSFYGHDGSDPDSYMDGMHYACVGGNANLIGYFCFGEDARIPTVEKDVYEEGFTDIGLGMKPELCGNGLGSAFLGAGLDFARKNLGIGNFRLSVAAFNERAVKVYARAGFVTVREVTNAYYKNKFDIMTLEGRPEA
ncbi:MAG TPA: GNAT family protein [Clostridia bacterium]|nr:GNAT family protein [Clostridia bacterium]